MCSELCKDFYVVYQLEMVAGEVESSFQLVVTFFFSFFLVSPYQTIEISLGQPSPPSYQLLPPPLTVTAADLPHYLTASGTGRPRKSVLSMFRSLFSPDNHLPLTTTLICNLGDFHGLSFNNITLFSPPYLYVVQS